MSAIANGSIGDADGDAEDDEGAGEPTLVATKDEEAHCSQWREVIEAHVRAIDWLESFIRDNPDRISETDEQVWVRGDLARYAIDKEPLLETARNPFSSAGLEATEVHPLIVNGERSANCCIQLHTGFDAPMADSVQAYFRGMINDGATFGAISQLRAALVDLYGLRRSPISEVLAEHLDVSHDAELDVDVGAIEVEGTNNWHWRVVDVGTGHLAIDVRPSWTRNWRRLCEGSAPGDPSIEQTMFMVTMLEGSPRAMCIEPYQFLYGFGAEVIIRAVGEFHKPVRQALTSMGTDLSEPLFD